MNTVLQPYLIVSPKIFGTPFGFIPKTISNGGILMLQLRLVFKASKFCIKIDQTYKFRKTSMIFMKGPEKTIIPKTLLAVNSGINTGLITIRGNFTH